MHKLISNSKNVAAKLHVLKLPTEDLTLQHCVLTRFIKGRNDVIYDSPAKEVVASAVRTKIQTKKRTLQCELKRDGKLDQSDTDIC